MSPYLFKSQTAQPKYFCVLITMKRQDWILLGICVLLVSLLYFLEVREGFVSVNPIPTDVDCKSIGTVNVDGSITGTPSSTMEKVITFIKNYKWNIPLKPNQENRIADSISLFYENIVSYDKLNTLITGYSARPTFEQIVRDANKLMKQPLPDSNISTITQNPQTSSDFTNEIFYASYVYIFGTDSSSSSPPSAPAASQQSITMYIPQPCSASFKSIPGGAVDIQCFN
jgi:hypothetical protein